MALPVLKIWITLSSREKRALERWYGTTDFDMLSDRVTNDVQRNINAAVESMDAAERKS